MNRTDRYIYDDPDWPAFGWNAAVLAVPLAAVRHKQGLLLGKMKMLGFESRQQATLESMTREVVKTSAIEGEELNAEEVRSSIACRLGIDAAGLPKAGRDVQGVVEMMLDATSNFAMPLSRERLFSWHAALFPTGRSGMQSITVGAWRGMESGTMRVVSGPLGHETIHFEAPSAVRLELETARLLRWFNTPNPDDPVINAAIAHLWFVTLHPFDDGNGRIARAIADRVLCAADRSPDRFYSMSWQIEAERKDYYRQLESAQRGDLDITRWLDWFLGCLSRALDSSERALASVLYKARLWQRINREPIRPRQRQVINRLLDDFKGFLTSSKYAKLAECSNDTALRDITELLDRRILIPNSSGGRSTSYRLADPQRIGE